MLSIGHWKTNDSGHERLVGFGSQVANSKIITNDILQSNIGMKSVEVRVTKYIEVITTN